MHWQLCTKMFKLQIGVIITKIKKHMTRSYFWDYAPNKHKGMWFQPMSTKKRRMVNMIDGVMHACLDLKKHSILTLLSNSCKLLFIAC